MHSALRIFKMVFCVSLVALIGCSSTLKQSSRTDPPAAKTRVPASEDSPGYQECYTLYGPHLKGLFEPTFFRQTGKWQPQPTEVVSHNPQAWVRVEKKQVPSLEPLLDLASKEKSSICLPGARQSVLDLVAERRLFLEETARLSADLVKETRRKAALTKLSFTEAVRLGEAENKLFWNLKSIPELGSRPVGYYPPETPLFAVELMKMVRDGAMTCARTKNTYPVFQDGDYRGRSQNYFAPLVMCTGAVERTYINEGESTVVAKKTVGILFYELGSSGFEKFMNSERGQYSRLASFDYLILGLFEDLKM